MKHRIHISHSDIERNPSLHQKVHSEKKNPSIDIRNHLGSKVFGAVVQLGERLTGSQEVTGSNPVGSIKIKMEE